ncbi:MAG: heparinase II/III family protein [Aestuariibacter sp.]
MTTIKGIYYIVRVLFRLSPKSLLRLVIYKASLRIGWVEYKTPKYAFSPSGVFHSQLSTNYSIENEQLDKACCLASDFEKGHFNRFFAESINLGCPPVWYGIEYRESIELHWSKVKFGASDIKDVWDVSRFGWVITLALASCKNANHLQRLNEVVKDWCQSNPINCGPNWSCAQEVSIRMINLLFATRIIGQDTNPSDDLIKFTYYHCKRVDATLGYSLAQDNNHGVSEAAALYIGGTWLNKVSHEYSEFAQRIADKGRRNLEHLCERLILSDGGFSMYSMNYHRSVLNTLTFVELWRRVHGDVKFKNSFYQKSVSMSDFLSSFVDKENGQVPNIGTNDGSNLFFSFWHDYQDFRPAIDWAYAVFKSELRYEVSTPLQIFKREIGETQVVAKSTQSKVFEKSGIVLLRQNEAKALLRFPSFQFRPGQSDLLHLDFWLNGMNILRDSGSYSYSVSDSDAAYFSSSKAHNTIQFDCREQMPKLSRFLYGEWPGVKYSPEIKRQDGQVNSVAEYTDFLGASHRRSVKLEEGQLTVEDDISGKFDVAVLRWKLDRRDWQLNGHQLISNDLTLKIETSVPPKRVQLCDGMESKFYSKKVVTPVLEIELHAQCSITSILSWRKN